MFRSQTVSHPEPEPDCPPHVTASRTDSWNHFIRYSTVSDTVIPSHPIPPSLSLSQTPPSFPVTLSKRHKNLLLGTTTSSLKPPRFPAVRMDTESGDSPPSYPGSPTDFDSLRHIHTSASDRGFPRVNSFDSTTATIGSPLPSAISGYDSPFHPTSPIRIQNLVVMRHSERMDDVDPTWTTASERPWDPPITESGKQMAGEVARKLRGEGRSIDRIVVSPFLRCVQTAAEVVKALMAVGSTRGGSGMEESNQILVSTDTWHLHVKGHLFKDSKRFQKVPKGPKRFRDVLTAFYFSNPPSITNQS